LTWYLDRLELVLALREVRLLDATAGQTKVEQEGKAMTFLRSFTNSVGATVLAGLLSTSAFAQAPSSDPYGPAGPPPDMQQQQGNPQNQYPQNQYGQPQQGQQGYADQQNGGPTPQQQAAATITDVQQAPPEIPDYQQPEAPGDGYVWTPGYWAWTGAGYEWVQGAWVEPPYVNALWTPGFWGDGFGGYAWYPGYWGPFVGYYGGINYGFGYFGIGFYGGYWGGGRFWYNRAYCNIGRGIGFHTYNRAYSGYSGRAGGNSFVRGTAFAGNRGAAGFRGSTVNGRTSSFAQGAARSSYTGGAVHNDSRSFNGAGNYNNGARNFAQPAQTQSRSFAQPGASRSFSQPSQGGNFSQPTQSRSFSAPSSGNYGGGFHAAPSGGMSSGGGGFHGGGGGGGGSHGGGGHR
jgi:hypothetical protein